MRPSYTSGRSVAALILLLAGGACGHGQAKPPTGGSGSGGGGAPDGGAGAAGSGGSGGGGAVDAPVDGAYQPPPAGRVDTLIDDAWRFMRADATGAEAPAFDDSGAAWSNVTIPHTWNALDGEDGGSYYRGVGWYRRHLTVAAATLAAGRHAFLQLDAASRVADVYVNGTHLGQHRGGFAAFRFDVTSALKTGDNVIAVKVDNSAQSDVPPLSADFTFFGGIYRDVHLLTTNDLHVDVLDMASPGVYLTPGNVSAASADLQARVRVTNAGVAPAAADVSLAVVDARGILVTRLSGAASVAAGATADVMLAGTIAGPHLWDGRRDPYLYGTFAEVGEGGQVTDVVAQPLGLRSFAVDPSTGFSLNGHPLDLHGVNRHQDRLDMGWAITNTQHDEDMALIVELGATAIRLAHYQHAQHFYDLADQRGLVVWAEMPLVNAITATQAFTDNAEQQMTELIRQSYNHPAICFWSIGNEQRTDDTATNALLTQLAALVRTEDPSRLSTYAQCCTSDTSGLPTHSNVTGYNEYFGWYNGVISDLGPWADGVHAARATTGIAVSEYGAGASIIQHADNPTATPASTVTSPHYEEYQSLLHEQSWQELQARPFIWGKFIWNMFDFASDGRNEGDTPGRNDKGLVTYDRKTKKDAFFWYKANWSTDPVLYITSRRFNPRPTATIDVKVYSNLDSVTLMVNGTSLGAKTSTNHIFLWPGVALSAGANKVDAAGTQGAVSATDTVTWMH
jgi:beta-galactosidase